MSSPISLSSSMRSNLLSLQNTSMLTDMTQEHLSTGKKVNSALDNPGSYFTSQSLNNRAADLSGRLDGIGQALQTLKATDKSLTQLTKLVEQSKALAQSASEAVNAAGLLSSQEAKDVAGVSLKAASNSGAASVSTNFTAATTDSTISMMVNGGTTREIIVQAAATTDSLVADINAQVKQDGITAYWNTNTSTIDFSAKKGTTLAINEVGAGGDAAAVFGSGRVGPANAYTFAAPVATDLALNAFDGVEAGDQFQMKVYDSTGASTTSTITISATDTISQVVDQLNAVSSANVTASFNTTTRRIEFTGKAGFQVEFNENSTTSAANEMFGGSKIGASNKTTFGDATGNTTVSKNLADFQDVMQAIDDLVQDASYKGKNLLKGTDSMTVLFNEDGSSKITVQGVDFSHDAGLAFDKNSTLSWSNMGQIQTSIDQAKEAIDTIRAQASKFGTANSVISTREDFTKNMVDTLKGGADKLVLADMNEEAANMLALQTQRSLATNSLSMASQAAQSVLQLFR